ncbi:MAG: hypothetical protein HeimC3_53020 [Candidatus Heimdallarchaeota archaeon LC_3]|nr:MAG: hypothetical protein HeimC3_53020 [Candidatus Heimdallarchaeota archaeon LC_3]
MMSHYRYSGNCPYCQITVHFTNLSFNITGLSFPLNPVALSDNLTHVALVKCDNCSKTLVIFFSYEVISENQAVYRIKATFPVISKMAKPDGVSDRIWDDYVESMICLGVDTPKAAVVLLRRATQSLMKELGADPKKNLVNQIRDLKDSGKISQELFELAEELRLWGNFGAHPDDDLLDDVKIDEANELKNVFNMLLDFTVIQKAKVKKIQEKRKNKKD